jgi:hypothetical protein
MPTAKPTPTQEENDLAATGQTVLHKEHDGSDHENPDTAQEQPQRRHAAHERELRRRPEPPKEPSSS